MVFPGVGDASWRDSNTPVPVLRACRRLVVTDKTWLVSVYSLSWKVWLLCRRRAGIPISTGDFRDELSTGLASGSHDHSGFVLDGVLGICPGLSD